MNVKLLQCVGAIVTKQPSPVGSSVIAGVSPNPDFISHHSSCFLPPHLLHDDFKTRLIIVTLLPPSVILKFEPKLLL